MSNFGNALRRLAGLHGLSNRETAALLGVSEQTISELTTGKREPGQATFQRVRAAFLVDPFAMSDGIEAVLPSLCDLERFKQVERIIRASKSPARERNLKAV